MKLAPCAAFFTVLTTPSFLSQPLVTATVLAAVAVVDGHQHTSEVDGVHPTARATTNLRGGSGEMLLVASSHRQTQQQMLGDWALCSASDQCNNGCCSSVYSYDSQLKCTPLDGGFRPDLCISSGGAAGSDPTSSLLGDWALCSASDQCNNGCCSSVYSDDAQLKCTPLDGGFRPDLCLASSGGEGGGPSPSGTCGNGNLGDGVCSDGTCCSSFGWCGTTAEHCGGGGGGPSDPAPTMPPPAPTMPPVSSPSGTCGNGNRGDGFCSDGTCCSTFGWCGTTAEHCDGSDGGGVPPPPPPSGGGTVSSPAIVLTPDQVQAGINAKGDSMVVSQQIVDVINDITTSNGYSLYRQIAFVAQTIWESGSYQFREEIDTANYGSYQACDSANPNDLPTTGKQYYGRGYLQLSWCYNYKAYGVGRMFNGDPDLFYNQPELVAEDEFFAMDSAAWFFENNVFDTSGQFGLTTNAINGALECSGGELTEKARKRYEVFVALANAVGLSGYSESGCYN